MSKVYITLSNIQYKDNLTIDENGEKLIKKSTNMSVDVDSSDYSEQGQEELKQFYCQMITDLYEVECTNLEVTLHDEETSEEDEYY